MNHTQQQRVRKWIYLFILELVEDFSGEFLKRGQTKGGQQEPCTALKQSVLLQPDYEGSFYIQHSTRGFMCCYVGDQTPLSALDTLRSEVPAAFTSSLHW